MSSGKAPSRSLASVKRVGWGVAGGILTCFVLFLPEFLTVSKPVGRGILAVEAWIPARTLDESVSVFNNGHYRYLVVVGGPIKGLSGQSGRPKTYDALAATRLEKLGFNSKKMIRIRVPAESLGDRTFATALAVKRWMTTLRNPVCCVDDFTEGVHSRKSWIIFRYAMGDRYRVGIIAGVPASYSPKNWFLTSRGIYIVMRNLVGYLYSKSWILYDNETSPQLASLGRGPGQTAGAAAP
jgi:hypothetical protein